MKPICLSSKQSLVGMRALQRASIAAVAAALAAPHYVARKSGVLVPEMILDAEHQFSNSQALTATALSTNVIDLGSVDRNIFNGEPMGVVVNVEVAADQTTGDEDYTFSVETASDSGITTARKLLARRIFESGTPTAPAEDADLLVAGFKFVLPLPMGTLAEAERYLALRYTLAGTTPTITVSAHLQPLSMIEIGSVHYPKGYTIS
jgi:hypothetical protein